jgi:esterase/lipase
MSSKKIHYKKMLFFIIIALSVIWFSGMLLDRRAELRVQKMYAHDHEGVIEGLQSIRVIQGKNRALMFIHGFADSPEIFSDLVDDIKNRVNADIYVPLLPFHGRDLQSLAQFNNQIILTDLASQINALSKKYPSLTVVGMSYGGALLTTLVNEKKIPDTVHFILYAPAFYITMNTVFGRLEAYLYGWWRNYCNYEVLGCRFPADLSGDAVAKPMFHKEKTLFHVVIPAVKQLYQLDLDNRQALSTIHRPYSLIMAVDDNRVSYTALKAACKANQPYCHFYSFPSGKHMIHWGANKKRFEELLIKLTT